MEFPKKKLSLKIGGPYTDYENKTVITRNRDQSSVNEEKLGTPLKGTAHSLTSQQLWIEFHFLLWSYPE